MDYVASTGTNYTTREMGKVLSPRECASTDNLLEDLSKVAKWVPPEYVMLKGGNLKPLGEVRLKGEQKIPIRVIGFHDEAKKEFQILIVCRHKDDRYKPADCLDTAADRYKIFRNGNATKKEHFNDDDEEIE